jgi:hypothetical protein
MNTFKKMSTREDPGKNKSSTSTCVSYEATEWGGPSDYDKDPSLLKGPERRA